MKVPCFQGEVETRWLRQPGKDRDMRLLTDFAFLDSRGVRWDAPAGRVINGASIPEIFWSQVVGTPYVGDYRRATVLHDVACDDQTRPHEEVHRMFYEAMRCDGVPEDRALLMYTAVRLFGPKWSFARARRNPQKALRSFNIDLLAATLDTALGERTRWRQGSVVKTTPGGTGSTKKGRKPASPAR